MAVKFQRSMVLWAAPLLCLWIWVNSCAGLDLSPCVNGTLDAPMLTNVSLTCEHTSSSLWWKMFRGTGRANTVAMCNNTQCTRQGNATGLQVSRPDSETSVLTVDLSKHRNYSVKVQCFSRHRLTCTVRSVDYSQPTDCKFDVNQDAMRISGSCEVRKIYASDGKYVCRWIRYSSNGLKSVLNGTFSLSYAERNATTNIHYKKGTCSFSVSSFFLAGVSNFSIHTSPGSEMHIATVTVDTHSNVTVSGSGLVNITQSLGKKDLKMVPCQSNKVIDVNERELIGLTCANTRNSPQWYSFNPRQVLVATCNTSYCTMQQNRYGVDTGRMLASRPNRTYTELYVDTEPFRNRLAKFSCYKRYYHNYCRIRSQYTSSTTNCHFDFNAKNASVTGSCVIPKMYSSDGRYTCRWIERYQEQTERPIAGDFTLKQFQDEGNGWTYRKATCSFSAPLFELDGTFTYLIDVVPGHREYIATVDVAVSGGSSSLTIAGRGHMDTRITRNVTDIQMYLCYGNTYDVVFGARVGLYCPYTRATVRWKVNYDGSYYRQLATCNATQCDMQGDGFLNQMLATRPNSTTSVLYASLDQYQDRNIWFQCSSRNTKHCTLRTVYSSPPTSCQFNIYADNSTVLGSCSFEKIYTTDNSYSCQFLVKRGNETQIEYKASFVKSSYYESTASGRKRFYRAVCSFSSSMVFVPGAYNYSVKVSPGSQSHIATLVIDEDLNVTTLSPADHVNASIHGTPPRLTYVDCGNSKEVSVLSQVALVCTFTYNQQREFKWKKKVSSYYYSRYADLARCSSSGGCYYYDKTGWFLTTRPNISTSILYTSALKLTGSNDRDVYCNNGYYSDKRCHVRTVYKSPATACLFQVNAVNMTISGSCYFAKVFASDNSYTCKWIQQFENQTEVSIYGYHDQHWYPFTANSPHFQNITCHFNSKLYPIPNSRISYTIDFSPGDPALVATVRIDEHWNVTVEGSKDVTATLVPGMLEAPTVFHCGEGNEVLDAPADKLAEMICPSTYLTVTWDYRYGRYHSYDSTVATCNTTGCTTFSQPDFLAVRPNSSVSILYADLRQFRHTPVVHFICKSQTIQRCSLRTVYTSPLTNCSLEVSADTMTVSGSCDVDRVFSSDGIVNCTLIEQYENQTTKHVNGSLPLQTFHDYGSDPFMMYHEFMGGTCSFSTPLLLVTGVFQFTVNVRPGSPVLIATLYLDGPFNMRLEAEENVSTTISGAPSEMNVYPCQDGQTVDIPEYTQAGLICRDSSTPPSDQLTWRVYPGPHADFQHGDVANVSCNSSACEVPISAADVLVTRPNASTSVLYLSLLTKRHFHQRMECRTPQFTKFCVIRAVHTSLPTNCRFDFNTTSYSITASCQVKKMFSSDGEYTCDWIQQVHEQTTAIPSVDFDLRSFRDPINKQPYKAGTCSVSFKLVVVTEQVFTFRIRVNPGVTTYMATLELGPNVLQHVRLTGGEDVETTIDGIPTAKESSTTTTTTPTTTTTTKARHRTTAGHVVTHRPPNHTSPKSPGKGSHAAQGWTYVAAGVGGVLGLLCLVVAVIIGVLVLRKLSAGGQGDSSNEGSEADEYFYTSRLKSGSISDIVSNVAIISSDCPSGHSSSCL